MKRMLGRVIGATVLIALGVWVYLIVFEDPHVAQGREIFTKYCVNCHGPKGWGNGFNAINLDPVPRDLSDDLEPYMAEGTNDQIFTAISFGVSGAAPVEGGGHDHSDHAGGQEEMDEDDEPIGSPLMPFWGFTLTDEEIWSLVAFIRTLHKNDAPPVEFEEGYEPKKLPIPSAGEVTFPSLDSPKGKHLVEEGQKFFVDKYGCDSCHQIGGVGGTIGPELDRAGFRLQPSWIFRWVINAGSIQHDTVMPNFALPDHEALAITLYLGSLQGKAGESSDF